MDTITAEWRDPDAAKQWPDPVSEVTRNIYAPANYPTHYGDVTSIVTPQWHLIAARNRPPELYRWGDDPAEISNLAGSPAVHDVLLQLNSLLRDRLASSALAQMAKEHTVPSR